MSGWGWNGNSGTHFGGTYAGADALLAKSKTPGYAKTANSAYLGRQYDGSISLTLYNTAIVTYHPDGTYTLFHGGYTSQATAGYINGNTPFRVGSSYNKKYPGWSLGDSGEFTPARVQKCRTCHGEGGTVTRRQCSGARRWSLSANDKEVCPGGTTKHRLRYRVGTNWDEYVASEYFAPCPHGERFERPHALGYCQHGRREAHPYGEIEAHECYRCKGEGRVDYGSQPIPIIWHGGAVLMTGTGQVLDTDVPRYYPTGKYPKAPTWTSACDEPWSPHGQPVPVYVPSGHNDVKHSFDSGTKDVLEHLLPGLSDVVWCPACGNGCHRAMVSSLIIHLNDSERWTRERIADWLDTLDADLRFPTPTGA